MGQKPALAFLLVLAVACDRPVDSQWESRALHLGLEDGIESSPRSGEPLVLRRELGSESTRSGVLRIATTVRQRGKAMPAIVTTRAVDLDVEFVPMEASNGSEALLVDVNDASVSLDPPLEGVEDELEESFDDVALRVIVDGRNRLIGLGNNSGGSTDGENGVARDIAEALERLVPEFPERPITTGDSWEFLDSFPRRLPGGGNARVSFTGRSRFVGEATWDGREVVVLGTEYRVTVFGRSLEGGISGEVTGEGNGRAIYLVDPLSGLVERAQASEATVMRVDLASRRERRSVEQHAESEFDWRIEE